MLMLHHLERSGYVGKGSIPRFFTILRMCVLLIHRIFFHSIKWLSKLVNRIHIASDRGSNLFGPAWLERQKSGPYSSSVNQHNRRKHRQNGPC